MDKKAFLAQFKPKVSCIKTEQGEVFVRELTIGMNNYTIFERNVYLKEEAKRQGLDLDGLNESEVEEALSKITDKYALARAAAAVLCDADGNLLFDLRNTDDLEQINQLSQSVLFAVNEKANPELSLIHI